MNKKLRLIITILVFAAFGGYFFANIEQFKPLLHVNIYMLGLIAILDLSVISANGLFVKFILQPFEKYIPITEAIYVSLISSVGNFFAPAGSGFGFRAIYLKKNHGLSYKDFVSTLSGNYVIVFLVNSFFALVSLYVLRDHKSPQYFTLVFLFAGIFIFSLLLSIFKLPHVQAEKITKQRHIQAFIRMLFTIAGGWNKVVENKKLMMKLIGIVIFNFIAVVLISKLAIASLHFTISFPALLLFSVLGSLSLFVNLTPANLGVKEAIYIFSSQIIGLSTSQILSVALIDRGVYFLVLVALWPISTRMQKLL